MDITSDEIVEAVEEPLRLLIEGFHSVIERIPAELANDVFDEGIVLTGGGASLEGAFHRDSAGDADPGLCGGASPGVHCPGLWQGPGAPGDYQRILGDARRRR